MKYSVTVVRTVHQSKTFEIESEDEKEARHKGLDKAYNEDFSGLEKEAQYEVDSCVPAKSTELDIPWIYDERVGCVAVYAGERRKCLSSPPEAFIFYRGFSRKGTEVGDWLRDDAACELAARLVDDHNSKLPVKED